MLVSQHCFYIPLWPQEAPAEQFAKARLICKGDLQRQEVGHGAHLFNGGHDSGIANDGNGRAKHFSQHRQAQLGLE